MQRIAISYRRQDSEAITGRIFDRLAARYGKEAIFRDIDNIPAGSDFREHIDRVLRQADLLLVIVGPKWLGQRSGHARIADEADPVRIEIETALDIGIPVVPVLVGDARMPSAARLPERIKDFSYRNALRVDPGQDFEYHITRLVRSMDGVLGGGDDAALAKSPAPEMRRFFGRRRPIVIAVLVAVAALAAVAITRLEIGGKPAAPPPMASGNQAAAPAPHPEATQAAALESALKQNKPAALEAYLLKNPAEPRRAELWEKVSALRRAEYTEWTIFDIAVKLQVPAYFQFSSIRPVGGNRYAMLSRIPLDRSLPTYIKDLPDGAYQQSLDVYDCQVAKSWEAEVTYYSQSGDELYHYKWADPEFIADIVQPTQIASGSLAASARRVVCNSRLRTPAVDKEQVAKTAFASLATAPSGDGELYYQLAAENASSVDVYASMIARYSAAKKMADVFGVAYGGLRYRATVQLVEIKCTENKIFLAKTEYYSDSTELIDIAAGDPGLATNWATIAERSPFDLLHRIVCPPTGK